jgi:hypothetical protein
MILTSVVGQLSRNFAALGVSGVVESNSVFPQRSWAFGSAPTSKRYSTKSRLVTLPEKHALYDRRFVVGSRKDTQVDYCITDEIIDQVSKVETSTG